MAGSRKGLTHTDLLNDLRAGKIAPLYFFHGEEDFLLNEAVEQVIAAALKDADRSFNLDILYGSDVDARSVVSYASTFPVNAERRVVVLRETEKVTDGEFLAMYADKPAATTTLILVSRKPDLRKRPFNVLKSSGMAIEFKPLFENQIPAWIDDHVRDEGHEIDPAASMLLAEYVGTSLREIQNELDKLYVYAGTRKRISVEDVQAISGISKELTIFELQRAMGMRNIGRTVEIIERMIDGGQPPIKITVMLGHYYIALRKLLDLRRKRASSQEQASALGVRPYFLNDYQKALDNYSEQELEEALLTITRADEQLKSTPYDAKQILQFMTAAILTRESTAGTLRVTAS